MTNLNSDSPINWEQSGRWTHDRGAMPGEPFAFLDGNRETARAAMFQIQTPGKPDSFEVRDGQGNTVAIAEFPEAAAKLAEERFQ